MSAYRNGDACANQRAFDVRRHIVVAFAGVRVVGLALAHQLIEGTLEVGLNIGVGVFVQAQGCRCVLYEQVE